MSLFKHVLDVTYIFVVRWSLGHGHAEAYRRIAGPRELEHLLRNHHAPTNLPSGSLDRLDGILEIWIIDFGGDSITAFWAIFRPRTGNDK